MRLSGPLFPCAYLGGMGAHRHACLMQVALNAVDDDRQAHAGVFSGHASSGRACSALLNHCYRCVRTIRPCSQCGSLLVVACKAGQDWLDNQLSSPLEAGNCRALTRAPHQTSAIHALQRFPVVSCLSGWHDHSPQS